MKHTIATSNSSDITVLLLVSFWDSRSALINMTKNCFYFLKGSGFAHQKKNPVCSFCVMLHTNQPTSHRQWKHDLLPEVRMLKTLYILRRLLVTDFGVQQTPRLSQILMGGQKPVIHESRISRWRRGSRCTSSPFFKLWKIFRCTLEPVSE